MEKYIIENGITYELKGEQYYPIWGETNSTAHHIGKYGRLHLDYIKQHKRGTYTTLLTEGKLNAHLHEIDVQANEMVEAIVANLAHERGIDEKLKASDALKFILISAQFLPCRDGGECIAKLNKNACKECHFINCQFASNGIGKCCHRTCQFERVHILSIPLVFRILFCTMNCTKEEGQ